MSCRPIQSNLNSRLLLIQQSQTYRIKQRYSKTVIVNIWTDIERAGGWPAAPNTTMTSNYKAWNTLAEYPNWNECNPDARLFYGNEYICKYIYIYIYINIYICIHIYSLEQHTSSLYTIGFSSMYYKRTVVRQWRAADFLRVWFMFCLHHCSCVWTMMI